MYAYIVKCIYLYKILLILFSVIIIFLTMMRRVEYYNRVLEISFQ